MLTVTEAASAHLAQLLDQYNVEKHIAFRFVDGGQGPPVRQDSERAGDTTFQHQGRTVLLLDAEVAAHLAKYTLDVEGTKLTLEHSKANDQVRP